MTSPNDPHVVAWTDQFGALLRDKCRALQDALVASKLDSLSHAFKDPLDGDVWRLTYHKGEYYVKNMEDSSSENMQLDIDALGVNR
jgi:hypothetical protein